MEYYRPVASYGRIRPKEALPLAGGGAWFTDVEVLSRGNASTWIKGKDIPIEVRECISSARPSFSGLNMNKTQVMGVLNITPDSFSDGGLYEEMEARGRISNVQDACRFIITSLRSIHIQQRHPDCLRRT